MSGVRRLLRLLSLLLFPPRCAVCGEVVPIGQAICPGCVPLLPRTPSAVECCWVCGKPLASCICRGEPLFFSRCLSAFFYHPRVQRLFTRLKAGDQEVADRLAAMMLDCWQEASLPLPDAVVYVPAVPGRYNQAAALADRVGAALGLRVLEEPLIRRKIRVQHTLGRKERRQNAVLSYERNGEPHLSGRILLIDDIITTGATLSRCGQLLLQSGADEVVCLTAATTLLDRRETDGRR